jgi:hypothetical protein
MNVTELLKEKLGLLCEIRELTEASYFGGEMDEDAAERYITLYETREPLMECIAGIDGELKDIGGQPLTGTEADEAKKLEDEIRRTAKAIHDIDETNKKSAAAYADTLKSGIRNIKKGHAANVAYLTEIYSDGGGYLDKRN